MAHYNSPPIDAPSSIIMLALCIVSILCTTYPVIAMLRIGTRSQIAELTIVINFAMTMWTVSSLPFLYHHSHLCSIFGVFLWYALVQLVMAASLMMHGAKEYIMEIHSTQGAGELADTRLTLNYVSRIILYVVPAIPPLFPLVTSSYGRMYCWCTIDMDAKWGDESLIVLNAACWSPIVIVLYHYYKSALRVAHTMSSSALLYQVVLNGPVMYGSATIGLFVCGALYSLIASLLYRKQSAESIYYGQYGFTVAACLLGVSYLFIFHRTEEHVKVRACNLTSRYRYRYMLCLFVSYASCMLNSCVAVGCCWSFLWTRCAGGGQAMEAYVRNADAFRKEFAESTTSGDAARPSMSVGQSDTGLRVPILSECVEEGRLLSSSS